MADTVIVLSGGRSRRFGGVHKPGVLLGGRSVISRIIGTVRAAVPDAQIYLAGPAEGLSEAECAQVQSVREEPVFSGPLAGIDAAVSALAERPSRGASDVTLILAGDMPMVSADHLRALFASCRETKQPTAGVDDRGQLQFLCAAWPTELLETRLAEIGDTRDKAVKLLFRGLEVNTVDVDPETILDFDTQEEFAVLAATVPGAAVPEVVAPDATAVPEVVAPDTAAVPEAAAPARKSRPVPEEVLRLRDEVEPTMGETEVEAILEFASRVKHSETSVSPVLAAFLAGRLHAADADTEGNRPSVEDALARVEDVLRRPGD